MYTHDPQSVYFLWGRLCGHDGMLNALLDAGEWEARPPVAQPVQTSGVGRELFAMMRAGADDAEKGASAMLAAAGL